MGLRFFIITGLFFSRFSLIIASDNPHEINNQGIDYAFGKETHNLPSNFEIKKIMHPESNPASSDEEITEPATTPQAGPEVPNPQLAEELERMLNLVDAQGE